MSRLRHLTLDEVATATENKYARAGPVGVAASVLTPIVSVTDSRITLEPLTSTPHPFLSMPGYPALATCALQTGVFYLLTYLLTSVEVNVLSKDSMTVIMHAQAQHLSTSSLRTRAATPPPRSVGHPGATDRRRGGSLHSSKYGASATDLSGRSACHTRDANS